MKQVYTIKNLDCAHCAKKIEDALNKDENIKKASLDFVGQKLFIDYKKEEYSIEQLTSLVEKVEDGVLIKKQELLTNVKLLSRESLYILFRAGIATVFLIASLLIEHVFNLPNKTTDIVTLTLSLVGYLIIGYDVILKALKNIFTGKRIFDENLLMTIATIGAFALKEYHEGIMVMLLTQIGDVLQDVAVNKSRNSILKTINLRPETANKLEENGNIVVVKPQDLTIGDSVIIKAGEIVPVDGTIIEGDGYLDTSSITGEFNPVSVKVGDKIYGGSVLQSNSITMKVEKQYKDSTVHKILELVSSSGENKSKAEKFISKFAKIYTPTVLALAVIVAIVPSLFNHMWAENVRRALTFLVISCPCAIVISVPLAFFVGLGLSAKNGIIVKSATSLDSLCTANTVVCDKTGTLTYGRMFVKEVHNIGVSKDEFIRVLAHAENLSSHPISRSITEFYGKMIKRKNITDFKEIAGKGVTCKVGTKSVIAGNEKLMKDNKIDITPVEALDTIIYLAINKKYCGYVLLNDKIKENTPKLLADLKKQKVEVVMLTGDKKQNGEAIAKELGLNKVYTEMLPETKVKALEDVIQNNKKGSTIFVGDGVNDAPSIMRADVGFAMGGIGSDMAVYSADCVIMNDDPHKIVSSIKIAKATRRRSLFNIIFALVVKVAIMVLSVCGYTAMWLAVLGDVGTTIVLIFGTLLLLNKKIK